jgi:hypothetical protein
MKKYLTFLFTKRPWAVVVNAFILLFFTIGLPGYYHNEWIVTNIWDIEETKFKVLFSLLLVLTGIASLLQVYDEFKKNK